MRYPDDSLVGRLLAGDEEAVGIVSRWISVVVTSYRFRELRNEWLDVHQDALILVIESLKRERFDPARDLRHYVQAITRHAALRALRRSRVRAVREGPSAAEPTVWADLATQVTIDQVLARASPQCRQLFLHYFLEGRGYEEIAEELGVPVGTVKSRVFRCLAAAAQGTGRRRRPVGPLPGRLLKG